MTELLEKHGFRAAALNGDMTQQLREQTLDRLRNGSLDIALQPMLLRVVSILNESVLW